MHGFPQAIKDLTATKGIRTTTARRIFKDFVPAADAIMVERVQARRRDHHRQDQHAGVRARLATPTTTSSARRSTPTTRRKTAGGSAAAPAVARGAAHAAGRRRQRPWRLAAQSGRLQQRVRLPPVVRPRAGRRGATSSTPSMGMPGRWRATCADLAMLLSVQAGYDPRAPLSHRAGSGAVRRRRSSATSRARASPGSAISAATAVRAGRARAVPGGAQDVRGDRLHVEEAVPDYPIERVWQSWQIAARLAGRAAAPGLL